MAELLAGLPISDRRVLVGPGAGMDCAVLDLGGDRLLVLKTDPITFTAGDLGWYLVQVNANDIATTGAEPRWLLATLLFPENQTTEELVRATFRKLASACEGCGITLIGGHTEVTQDLDRPIAVGAMIGEVARHELITPSGARPGDILLLTKFVPIEAVAILCQEFPGRLTRILTTAELDEGANYHRKPGISVLQDALIARAAGSVSAMHDPTEGGLASAVWEFAEASGRRFVLEDGSIPVSSLGHKVCQAFQIDPWAAISSGALLVTAPGPDHGQVCQALEEQGIPCTAIGRVEPGAPGVWLNSAGGLAPLPRPERDELARLYDRL
jgi:hydrogenase maturation factor